MRLPLLLRLLLCLCLVLDGMGTAVAGVHMAQQTPAEHAQLHSCLGHGDMSATHHGAATDHRATGKHCCTHGTCNACGCAHAVAGIAPSIASVPIVIADGRTTPLSQPAEPSPKLPNLDRPPIGQAN